jgi:hypothetical protein
VEPKRPREEYKTEEEEDVYRRGPVKKRPIRGEEELRQRPECHTREAPGALDTI